MARDQNRPVTPVECQCGELISGETGEEVYRKYHEHLAREDHQPSPAQWHEAYDRIQEAKEAVKARESVRGAGSR